MCVAWRWLLQLEPGNQCGFLSHLRVVACCCGWLCRGAGPRRQPVVRKSESMPVSMRSRASPMALVRTPALQCAAVLLLAVFAMPAAATQCGVQTLWAPCPAGQCCSQHGWCGTTAAHCSESQGCQMDCAVCGDGVCLGETCGTCPQDCGPCPSPGVTVECVNPQHYALTFDDGPSGVTDDLLDTLTSEGVVASFFVIGNQVEARKATLQRAHTLGHFIASHSHTHPDLATLSDEDIQLQVSQADAAIRSAICVRPTIFRPPYGSLTASGLAVVESLGYKVVNWNLDTFDWKHAATDPQKVLDLVQQGVDGQWPGSIIHLQHDRTAESVSLVPSIIDIIRNKGYTFVSVPECMYVGVTVPCSCCTCCVCLSTLRLTAGDVGAFLPTAMVRTPTPRTKRTTTTTAPRRRSRTTATASCRSGLHGRLALRSATRTAESACVSSLPRQLAPAPATCLSRTPRPATTPASVVTASATTRRRASRVLMTVGHANHAACAQHARLTITSPSLSVRLPLLCARLWVGGG